jgi:integrase
MPTNENPHLQTNAPTTKRTVPKNRPTTKSTGSKIDQAIAVANIERGHRLGTTGVHEVNTLRETVDAYLTWHPDTRSANWNRDNGYVLRRWAQEIDCETVQELDTAKLQTWFSQKLRTTKVQTAAAYVYQIQTFLNWCRDEQQLVTVNVADKVRIPKHTKNVRRRFLSLPDAQRLIDACDDQELKFALYCSIHAGFRYIEVNSSKT